MSAPMLGILPARETAACRDGHHMECGRAMVDPIGGGLEWCRCQHHGRELRHAVALEPDSRPGGQTAAGIGAALGAALVVLQTQAAQQGETLDMSTLGVVVTPMRTGVPQLYVKVTAVPDQIAAVARDAWASGLAPTQDVPL